MLPYLPSAALILLGAAGVWVGFDAERNASQRLEFYGDHKHYEQVLAVASKLQRLEPQGEVRLQLALYHAGRLGEDLFAFRNQTVWDILPSLGYGLEACRPQSQMLLEMGQLSEAEHMAHEALEWEGDRADILKVLAAVNILKNRPEAARVFLNVLAQVPFEGTWAKARLRGLQTDPQLEQEPDWAPIRARLVSTDMPHTDVATASLFRQLLRANPRNQMAFEYLMAHYLLTLQLDQFIDHFKELGTFGYARIPRHYEEAILLFQKSKRTSVDLGGRAIRPETQARFQRLSQALDRGTGKTEEGRVALGHEFGDTFWYYYLARQAGSRTPPRNSADKYE